MYLFQKVGQPELGFPNREFTQLWTLWTSNNCMNKWLGEPVPVF